MGILTIRPKSECRFDLVALGEVMLRLDPGETRIATTRSFRVWEGGGEYNVARGLKRCFGLDTAIVTALVDNPVGRLLEDLVYQGGVDQTYVKWFPYDGIGHAARNPLNFTERGFGVRGAVGCSDRAHSAASQLRPGDIDWEEIFKEGVRWFHCGGIFAALSEGAAAVAAEAMAAARESGAIVSYDLNYRPSLWAARGGKEGARATNQRLAPMVDVMCGNEEDFEAALGFPTDGVGDGFDELDPERFAETIRKVMRAYPRLSVVATTLRVARSASRNDWRAMCVVHDNLYTSRAWTDLEILDRVGGGDSFLSGLAYGLLAGSDVQEALEYGAAHGALAMTTPGDTSMATASEVRRLVADEGARIQR